MKHLTCPVALHPDGAPLRLALETGQMLPPFTEFLNDPAPAAARHLFSTLGLETRSAVPIGVSKETVEACTTHFVLCRIAPPTRRQWKHLQPDGTMITAHWVAFEDLPSSPRMDWIKANL
ncbi:MAG: hypothetical protein ABJJ53_14870 [Sulfitobacter sp.]